MRDRYTRDPEARPSVTTPFSPPSGYRLAVAVVALVAVLGGLTAAGFVAPVAGMGGENVASVSGSLGPGALALSLEEPDDDDVVVSYEEDYLLTGSRVDPDDLPQKPHVETEDGERIVADGGELWTENGSEVTVDGRQVQVRTTEPELIVSDDNILNDTVVLNDDGYAVTEEGGDPLQAEKPGSPYVKYPHFDSTNVTVDVAEPEPVGEGETLEVTFELENHKYGEASDAEILLLGEDGELANETESIDLGGGEGPSEFSFDYDTESGDTHATEVVVEVDGTSDRAPVTIHEAGVFVERLETNTPAAGDDLEVTADINRYGDYPEGEQEYVIDFYVDDTSQRSLTVDIGTGGETTETFVYQTTEDDSPSVDVEVVTGDDSNSTTADVLGDAYLERHLNATIVDRNWPEEGEELELTGRLEYDGIEPDGVQEYPLELYIDGTEVDNATVDLSGDGAVEETFTYQTEKGDAPRVDARLVSPGDEDRARPRVDGSGFAVTIEEVTDPVNESDTAVVIAQIENTGDIADEQDVRLRVDSAADDPDAISREVVDNATVSLGTDERTTERFTYRTTADDVPLLEVAVITDDDEATATTTVRDSAPRFDVTETSADVDDAAGEVTLSATVNNTGLETDEQYVEFLVDGEVAHIDRVTLGPWEERTLTSTIDAPDPGTYDVSVVTDNVTETVDGAFTVERPLDDDPDERDDDPPTDVDDDPDDGVDDETDDTEPPAEDDDGVPWYLVALGVLGVLASVLVLVVYRNDPENFPPDAARLQQQAQSALQTANARVTVLVTAIRSGDPAAIVATLKRTIGLGAGSLVVQNELPREALVRVQCRTGEDTVVLEDLELAPNERRELGSLPDAGEFTVGAGVEDITSHQEVFSGVSGDVGVVLKAEGILIANLG